MNHEITAQELCDLIIAKDRETNPQELRLRDLVDAYTLHATSCEKLVYFESPHESVLPGYDDNIIAQSFLQSLKAAGYVIIKQSTEEPIMRMAFRAGDRIRDLKTKVEYIIKIDPDMGRLETTGEPAYSYQSVHGGPIIHRSQDDMEDGRFQVV